jgi:hypothetical protein
LWWLEKAMQLALHNGSTDAAFAAELDANRGDESEDEANHCDTATL